MVHPSSLANLRPPWQAGDPDNPGKRQHQRMPPVTAALRKLFDEVDAGTGETNAEGFARLAMARAGDQKRRDAVLWAKLILERVDGPVRKEIELSIGMPELLRNAHERWLKRQP